MDLKLLLNSAIARKSEGDLKKILSRYDDEYELQEDCTAGLFVAVADKNLAAIKALIAAGANIHAREKKSGQTPLHVAIKNNHVATVKLLIEQGAQVNTTNRYTATALHTAVECNNIELVKFFLEHGGNIEAKKFYKSPLFVAVEKGHSHIVELLLARGCDVNPTSITGVTALHKAVEKRNLQIVQMLLAHGAKPCMRWFRDSTLNLAVRSRDLKITIALLGHDRDEDCPEDQHEREKIIAAELAMSVNNKDMLHCLLKYGRLQVNLQVSDRYLLHRAVQAGWLDTLELLLREGASTSVTTAQGTTALQMALRLHNNEAVRLLLDRMSVEEVNAPETFTGLTALHLAVQWGELEIVELLLSRGAEVENSSAREILPLQMAFEAARLDLAELLMARGAQIPQPTWPGSRPLELAINWGWLDMCRRLLDSGLARANDFGFDGASMLVHAVHSRDLRMVRLLLENGADVAVAGRGPLHQPIVVQAVELRSEPAVLEELLKNNAAAQVMDSKSGLSALQLAVTLNALENATLLVEHGADIDCVVEDGSTALLLALDKCNRKMVEMLVRAGANAKLRRPGCPSPLQRVMSMDWQEHVQLMIDGGAVAGHDPIQLVEPLYYAVSKGDAHMFFQLLDLGADALIDVGTGSRTMLHVAATRHCAPIVDELLKRGIPVDVRDEKSVEGLTPLHVALLSGNEETAMLLLDRGASVRTSELSNHRTPLHLAAETGCARVAYRLLTEKRMPVDLRTTHGVTPLQVAAIHGHRNVAELLIRYGARIDGIVGTAHYSPLHCAISHLNYNVVELLLSENATAFGCGFEGYNACSFAYARRNLYCERLQQLLLQYEPVQARPFVRNDLMSYLSTYTAEKLKPMAAVHLKHLARRGPPLNSRERSLLKPMMLEFYDLCADEMQRMRRHQFFEEITMDSLLDRDIFSLGGFVRNNFLMYALKHSRYSEKYPLYAPIITDCLARARDLEMLYVNAEQMLYRLYGIPIEVGREILKMVRIIDLRNFNYALPEQPGFSLFLEM